MFYILGNLIYNIFDEVSASRRIRKQIHEFIINEYENTSFKVMLKKKFRKEFLERETTIHPLNEYKNAYVQTTS